jgi:hypothetical protein
MHNLMHYKHEDGTPYDIKQCPIVNSYRTKEAQRIDNEVFWRADGTFSC